MNGLPGRCEHAIAWDQIHEMRTCDFNWAQIARELDLTPKTLYRSRISYAFVDPTLVVDQEALDDMVYDYLKDNVERGEVTT